MDSTLTRLASLVTACLLTGLADSGVRAEATGGPAVRASARELVQSADGGVRVAAIRVLGRVGTAADVPLLAELAATGPGEPERTAAAQSLASMRGSEVDAAVIALLETAAPKQRVALVRSLGERHPRGAVQIAVARVSDPDAEVRQEASRALQVLADVPTVPVLVELLMKASAAERSPLEQAILSACRRGSDPSRHADPLVAVMQNAEEPLRCLLLPIIGQLGGSAAMEAIQSARKDSREAVREAATRGLCNWPDASAGADLMALAKDAPSPQVRSLAVRAVARVLPRATDRPPAETATALVQTLALAETVEDKRLVISRLASVRAPESLATAVAASGSPDLRDEAIRAVIELARGMWGTHQQAAREALEKILPLTKDPELLQKIDRIINNPDDIRKGKAA